MPSSAAYLDGLADGAAAGTTMTEHSRAYWAGGRSFDQRHVPGPLYVTVDGERVPHQAVWIRPFDALRPVEGLTDEQRDLAALAYVCDYTILEPVLRVLGLPWARPGLVTASLDHALWFHRSPARVFDDWVLYLQEAVAADDGRGLATGRFFTRDRPSPGHRRPGRDDPHQLIRPASSAQPGAESEGHLMHLSPSAYRRHLRP